MENLTVVHKKGRFEQPLKFDLSWETCVRHIAFCEDETPLVTEVQEDYSVFRGGEAYLFILEVICGLHSPLVGETEILGQFKAFIESEQTRSSLWFTRHRQWFEQLLSDAKAVRKKYLIGLGSQSYGSLVRRYCKGVSQIDLIGSGRLVEDILPWLKKDKATVFARNEKKITQMQSQFPNLSFFPLERLEQRQGVLVVSAPVSAQQVEKWLKENKYHLVLDLRGESAMNPICVCPEGGIEVVKLQEMFAEINENRDRIHSQIVSARNLALSLSQKYANQMQVRPFGWDDLCVYQ